MSLISFNFALLLLISSEFQFVVNQNDYEYYDDSYTQELHNNRNKYEVTYLAADPSVNDRARIGIVDSILGLISGGKCLIKCVLRLVKNCYGIIQCTWDCFLPDQPMNRPVNPYKDSDIVLGQMDDNSLNMTPRDIVRIAECYTMCLVRYLPRSLTTLIDWLGCTATRCLCIGAKE